MLVVKRDGRRESVKFDKITARIEKLSYGLDSGFVEPIDVAKKVIEGLYDGVSTQDLDNLAAEIAATMTVSHPDYAKLAARIAISNLHKTTSKSFSNTMKRLYTYVDPKTGENAPLISKETYGIVKGVTIGLGLQSLLQDWNVKASISIYSDSSAARSIKNVSVSSGPFQTGCLATFWNARSI